MTFLKKLHPEWSPSEKPNIAVGEIIDFPAPYVELVKTGMATLVDELGNELELPGQVLTCPICFTDTEGINNFVAHVNDHAAKTQKALQDKIKASKAAEFAEETLRAKVQAELTIEDNPRAETFGEKMAKARAAKKAEREGKNK